jgi:hypothetical protein
VALALNLYALFAFDADFCSWLIFVQVALEAAPMFPNTFPHLQQY